MSHYGSGIEYGLHCLLHLVGRADREAPSSRDLAEFQGVSTSYVAKLFTRLAFWIATNIETFGFGSGVGPDPVMIASPQTHRNYAWRDYGNRVGVWQLFDLFDEMGLATSCLVNRYLYDEYPEIFDRIRARGDPIVGHGRTNAEMQRGMWEEDERRLIAEATTAIESLEGRKPNGWLGPGAMETSVTPDLLKEAGYTYVLDWPCDDQPIWLETRAGKILSVP